MSVNRIVSVGRHISFSIRPKLDENGEYTTTSIWCNHWIMMNIAEIPRDSESPDRHSLLVRKTWQPFPWSGTKLPYQVQTNGWGNTSICLMVEPGLNGLSWLCTGKILRDCRYVCRRWSSYQSVSYPTIAATLRQKIAYRCFPPPSPILWLPPPR